MSIIGSNILAGAAGSGVSAYEIEQSLRFDGSSYLTRSSGSSGAQTFTLSFWAKKTGVANYNYPVFGGGSSTSNYGYINYNNGQYLTFGHRTGGSGDWNSIPNASYRDTGAWYHHVVVLDFSNATQGDRYRLYTNGVEVDSFSAQTLPSNTTTTTQFFRSGENIRIGCNSYNTSNFFDGYFAEFHCVYGSALDPDQFGEYDDNGVWRPIEYTGSHGTEGFYLKFDPSATNGIGHDHSGNGNNFTATGFTTSGTGTDVMSDTPTTNYATLNPLAQGSTLTLSNGNLSLTGGHGTTTSTIAVTAGMKAYMEYQISSSFVNGSDAIGFGVAQRTDPFSSYPGSQTNVWWVYQSNLWYIRPPTGGANYAYKALSGNTVQIAVDYDAGKVWIGINNTWYDQSNGSSGDPAAGTGEMFSTTFTDPVHFFIHSATNTVNSVNFGQRAFAYTPPTGFNALNTSNLPAPTVKDGSDYFNTVLWTGDSVSGRAVTGVGFQPDFLWIKRRNAAVSSYLQNSVTGATNYMFSDDTVQERNLDDSVDSFDTDGFTLGNDGGTNGSGGTYVGWNWLAGGTGSSNTDGSITSTVSTNPSAGFSIVSYSGATGQNTVGHGLGVEPDLIFYKRRSAAASWIVYSKVLGSGSRLILDANSASAGSGTTNGGLFGSKTFNSTVFSVNGDYTETGASGSTYVAYCFAEVEGYSRIGSYVGNGSNDGTFVYTGHQPRWIIYKRTDSAGGWIIYDTARATYNPYQQILNADTSNAETGNPTFAFDILSNGFKFRGYNTGSINASGGTYVYMSFAEHPFGGSGVSPATAR